MLVDTSIWINHFQGAEKGSTRLLTDDPVWIHPFIIGELALGHLTHRKQMIH